jgi:hypothetical protein
MTLCVHLVEAVVRPLVLRTSCVLSMQHTMRLFHAHCMHACMYENAYIYGGVYMNVNTTHVVGRTCLGMCILAYELKTHTHACMRTHTHTHAYMHATAQDLENTH